MPSSSEINTTEYDHCVDRDEQAVSKATTEKLDISLCIKNLIAILHVVIFVFLCTWYGCFLMNLTPNVLRVILCACGHLKVYLRLCYTI